MSTIDINGYLDNFSIQLLRKINENQKIYQFSGTIVAGEIKSLSTSSLGTIRLLIKLNDGIATIPNTGNQVQEV